jgi:hypothetical protein
MSILNLNVSSGRGPVGSKKSKLWMGVGLLVAVLGFGSTLASSITINGDANTEFGQGVQRTVYCGNSAQTLKVMPVSLFTNKSGNADPAGTFAISGVKVFDIPAACTGIDFVLTFYDDRGGQSPQPVASASASPSPSATANPALSATTLAVFWKSGISDTSTGTLDRTYKASNSDREYSSSCQNYASNSYMSQGSSGALLSLSKSGYASPCRLAFLTVDSSSKDAFQVNFKSGSGITNFDSSNFGRIVIETQEDTFGVSNTRKKTGSSSGTDSSGSLGLIYDGLTS